MFEKDELVLIRNPGLHSILDSVWDDPFEVMEVPNDMHLIIATLGKKHKRVHVNLLASERSERDTLSRSSMENAIHIYIYIYIYIYTHTHIYIYI